MKILLPTVTLLLLTTIAVVLTADTNRMPFTYQNPGVEQKHIHIHTWEFVGARIGYDMTKSGEPEVCFVDVNIIHEAVAEIDLVDLSVTDDGILFGGNWVPRDEFEQIMLETNCRQ